MKTMKKVGILALVLVTALLLAMMIPSVFAEVTSNGSTPEAAAQEMWRGGRRGGRGGHGGRGGRERIAEPENAIGKDKAQAAALADAGVTAEQAGDKIRVRTDKLTDGTVIYAVRFVSGDKSYSYQINATTGAIVSKNSEAATENGFGRRGGREQVAEPENAIGKDKAQAAALADAGVTAEQAEGKIRVHTEKLTDGTVVYAVHFAYNNQMYYYQINATTGAVADKKTEAVTENGFGRRGGREKVAEPENAIGKDKAQAAALADAGVTAEQVGNNVRVHTAKLADGTVVYTVRFLYNGQLYSYQINATTGAVVDKTAEAATTDNLGRGGRKGRGGRGKGMRGMPAAPADGTNANAT